MPKKIIVVRKGVQFRTDKGLRFIPRGNWEYATIEGIDYTVLNITNVAIDAYEFTLELTK